MPVRKHHSTPKSADVKTEATNLAKLGYFIFPLSPRTKRPLAGSSGLKDATSDLAQIEQWWADNPSANIGLRCDGLLVIDVDLVEEKTKPNTWLTPERLRSLSIAPHQTTWSGGRQFIFRQPAGKHYRNTTSALAPHVDTRGYGGYIVVPPSFVQEGERSGIYQYMPGRELNVQVEDLPEPPDWLIAELNRIEAERGSPNTITGEGGDETFNKGRRNDSMFRTACAMRKHGCDESAILAALTSVNERQCKPPLPGLEVQKIAKSAGRYAPAPQPDKVKPNIVLPGAHSTITKTGAALGQLMAASNCWYLRGGVPVSVTRKVGDLELRPLKAVAACSDFERVGTPIKFVLKDGKPEAVQAVVSKSDAERIIEAKSFRDALPPLNVISRCPVLVDRRGRLEVVAGYDRESQIYALGSRPVQVPLDMAVRMIEEELLKDFQFATAGDRSRAIAAVITPALVFGGLLGGRAPIDLGEADDSQAGKGYRNKLTAAVYRNVPRTVTQRERGVGSLLEMFDSTLIYGAPFVSIDNLRGVLGCEAIESFMTEPKYLARIPYVPPMEIDATKTIVMLTSNKAELTRDLANRSSVVRIEKRPDDYKYQQFGKRDLLAHVMANQAKYLGAVFAVVEAWHRAGKPRLENQPHDFKAWAGTLGWIVENIFKAAPLVEGHREIQQRMSSPDGNFVRDLALAVLKSGNRWRCLRAGVLVEILRSASVAIPGEGPKDASRSHNEQAAIIGRILAKHFKTDGVHAIDGNLRVTRKTVNDIQGRAKVGYFFFRVGSQKGSPGQNSPQ